MALQNNDTYYAKNREARKAYQLAYYHKNVDRIKRKRELDEVLDPEAIEARKVYNRKYYLKNRARIREQRAQAYLKRKSQ